MAKRPSVQEILEAARRGGPARPAGEGEAQPSPPAAAPTEPQAAPPSATSRQSERAAPANVPTPATLGRPLTIKEKLAAARAGGAVGQAPSPAPVAPAAEDVAEAEAAPAVSPTPPADIPTPATLGRPLTLQEKLAAARAGSGGAGAKPTAAKPSAAKPAAAKPAAAKTAAPAAKAAPQRVLPPIDQISDPKDLAEALRQTGVKKEEAVTASAKAQEAPAARPAREKETRPQSVLPRPSRAAALASTARTVMTRRPLLTTAAWIWIGWGTFVAGLTAFTAMMGRFMFPNVLAEPPSTIKIGLPSNYEPEAVNERFKAEWGFWVVRSTRYNGQDILYAIQSVCTHLGCPPNWLAGEQKFKCPCHGSGFYISGINFEGPAPRPLERFKVTLADDGQVVVDKSQKFQQELGQWSDPDSYITV